MIDIFLTRHGETVWNTELRMQGRSNSPLTENGMRGAERLGLELSDIRFGRCIVSPLPRAMHTAYLITSPNRYGVKTDLEPLLLEMDLGSWEGLQMPDAKERYPETFEDFKEHPDRFSPVSTGETFKDVRDRAQRLIERIRKEYQGKTGDPILMVSHMILVQAFLNIATGAPFSEMRKIRPIEQTKIYRIRLLDGPGSFEVDI